MPTSLGGTTRIASWLIERCTTPLRAEAFRALHDGETLTFGKFSLDRDGIRGPRWSARWSDLSLVRFEAGKLFFFRRQRVIPWRSIGQDDVPHPTLFSALVKECAKTFGADDPFSH